MEYLLDQTRKFMVLGPDECVWFFVWESEAGTVVQSWHAYNKKPGSSVFLPAGPWSETSVLRFLNKYTQKLTDSDRIDLFLYLHKGGFEKFLQKNRIQVEEPNDNTRRRSPVTRK